jgi:cytochrome c556
MLGPAFIFEARLFATRNHSMKFTISFSIATLATLSLGAFLFAQGVDIKEIMTKANKAGGLFPQIQKGLKAPAPNWANLKNDSDELVSLATMLGKSKPPKGDAASWATMSKGYLDEATALKTAIAAMNKAGADAAIGKLATSCTGCHKAHKN